ncbi:MAG: hypothetical protein WKF43_06895 [Acidimicrobiales bacterium]
MTILTCLGLLIFLGIACGSETDAKAGSASSPDTEPVGWSPPKGPGDITGPAAAVITNEPAAGDCAPSEPDSGDEPVTSGDQPVCGSQASARLGTVRIEDGDGRYPSAVIAVDDATDIRRRTGSRYEEQEFSALTQGALIEVWFDGPVAESFPVQARAGTIVIDP